MSVKFTSYAKDVLSAEQAAKATALEIIGGKAEGYAAKLCPVDTGRLKGSITHKQVDDDTVVIGTNVSYAPYVELGHHTTGGSFVAGKPFLRPAAEGHRSEYIAIIKSVMGK